jgi:phospholipid/cholesterol/gamma-HCH transport system substrate-binding protein
MTSKATKIRIGLFTAVSAALLAIVLVVFGGVRFWRHRDHYRVVFSGSVMGLEHGAPVYLNGIKVGTVNGVETAPDDLRKVAVRISVNQDTPIHTDTHAMLQLAGITGLKVIDLRDGTLEAPVLPPGGTIAEGKTTLDKLEAKANAIVDQSQQLMERANKIVDNLVVVSDPKSYTDIQQSAKRAADQLAETSTALHAMVSENRAALRQSIDSINTTAKSASQLLDGQVTQLVTKAGDFFAQLDGIVRDNQGTLRAAVFDFRQASRSFKDFAREVRQKPSRLLFSTAPSERKLP